MTPVERTYKYIYMFVCICICISPTSTWRGQVVAASTFDLPFRGDWYYEICQPVNKVDMSES